MDFVDCLALVFVLKLFLSIVNLAFVLLLPPVSYIYQRTDLPEVEYSKINDSLLYTVSLLRLQSLSKTSAERLN